MAGRARPGSGKAKPKEEAPQEPEERTNEDLAGTMGDATTKSRQKADHARRTADAQAIESAWPMTPNGDPMAKITMSCAELIPNGQFANVSVGPVQITVFVDPYDDGGLSDEVRANLAKAANDLAEVAEVDVIGVQRNLVLESLQQQVAANNN
jgi:hypothetical protein